jgi:cell division protein FtsA
MAKTAYVLDIGTGKTTCLAATEHEDALTVVSAAAVATRGVKKGRILEPEAVAECAKAAIAKVREETGKPVDRLVVAAPGSMVKSEQSRGLRQMYPAGKEIHQEDLLHVNEHSRQIMFPPGYELLQTLACEYRIDGEPVQGDPLGRPAKRLEVVTHVMTGNTKDLDRLRGIVKLCGAEVIEFVPSALASGLGSVRPEDANAGCLVVDLGAGTTDVAVFERGACTRIATVEANAAHVTSDIATLIKVSPEDAESLKTAHGHADPAQVREDESVSVKQVGNDQARAFPRKVLSEIIESRVREIASLLREELLQGDKRRELPKTIVLTGGGSQLAGTDEVFKRVFGAESVRLGSPRLAGTASRRAAAPEMSAAVGLALFALESEEDELAPVAGPADWKEKFRSLKSIFGARS